MNRKVILPKGEWFNFWNMDDQDVDQMVSNGPAKVELAATLERIPVFVRAGSILPMDENGKIVLHIYPINTSDSPILARGSLYTDAGDGYGPSRVDHFHLNRGQDGLELVHISDGEFHFPETGLTIKLHGVKAAQVSVDGNPVEVSANRAEVGDFKQVKIAVN